MESETVNKLPIREGLHYIKTKAKMIFHNATNIKVVFEDNSVLMIYSDKIIGLFFHLDWPDLHNGTFDKERTSDG